MQLVAISAEPPFAQKTFAESIKLPYPLLSDTSEGVIRAYGVVYGTTGAKVEYPEFTGQGAGRSFFLIDRQGIVRGRWIGEDMAVFPNEKLLKAVQEMARPR